MEMSPSALEENPEIADMLSHDSEGNIMEKTVELNDISQQPEMDLLICCARARQRPSYSERVKKLLEQDVDWEKLLRLAAFHRMQPLLYNSLVKTGSEEVVPPAILDRFNRSMRFAAVRNLTLLKEMERLAQRFADSGIPAIAFKGPLLAQRAYGSLGLRPCVDLDILIPKEAFEEVEELLDADSYRQVPKTKDLEGVRKTFHLYLARQCTFVRPPAHGLDIHTAVMPPGYHPLDFDALHERSQTLSVSGMKVPGFAPEDLLLILCFHGVKNRWEALKHVCDVAELTRAHPNLDWDIVAERARAARGERILWLGLYLAHTLLEAELPPDILQNAKDDRYVGPLAEKMTAYLQQSHMGVLNSADRMQFHLQVQDSLPTKVRYIYYCLLRYVQDALPAVSEEEA